MDWHSISEKEVFLELKSNQSGISSLEAKRRLLDYGPSTLVIKKEISPLKIFINQFKNMLVILLLFAAVISFLIGLLEGGDFIDSILIFAIVIANAVFGFFQEYKAERTIEELTKMAAPHATVIRNGKEEEIDSESIVPGDILILREGDKIAADARIIECFSMYCDESMLTGESVPAVKKNGTIKPNLPLAERSNMVYMNTIVTRGHAIAIVVQSGLKTEVGKIAKEISEAPDKITRFQIEIEDLGKKISFITLGILIIIAVTEFLLRTGDIIFIFIAAVALGVAAIPEGLPAVVTLALSIATNRMLKQHALMRRLSTIQDLGSIDVICTDKTGTLTENVMTVTTIFANGKSITVGGNAFDKNGTFKLDSGNNPKIADLVELFRCAILCNDAHEVDGKFKGDPTEIAVLIPAYKAGMAVDHERIKFKRIGEVSFSSERKMMSTLNSNEKSKFSYVKGAPEVLIPKCNYILENGEVKKLTPKDRKILLDSTINMASNALRVLGFAYRENPPSSDEKDTESELIFVGLMGMLDPPRTGVREAIADCRSAGIRVVMITGDNKYTAETIGRELGFNGNVITGDELDSLPENQLLKTIESVDIYARTSPKHKVLLLNLLKKNGHIVCMTGDGVNDAAAIKNSDVGISMGIRGTEVTKQASDMIVLDDNFITIRNAIAEGRGTFDNIRKFVVYLLGANISEVLIIFFATITTLGISPKIAIQLLWINLVTDGLPALALGVDPPAKDVMSRKPRKKDQRIVDKDTAYFLAAIGISATIALLLLYSYTLSINAILGYTVLFSAFVIFEMFIVYVVRWRYNSDVFSNKWLHLAVALSILLQLGLIYSPFNTLFGIVPLSISEWLSIGACLLIFMGLLWIALKVEKFFVMSEDIMQAKIAPYTTPKK